MWKHQFYMLFSIAGMELYNEEGITSRGIGGIVFIAFCVIMSVILWIPNIRARKKGGDSEEKKRIAEIVDQIAAGDKVTPAYASWMTVESRPFEGIKLYRYWWYAIGFNSQRIYIAPISISDEDGKISYKDSFCIERSQLGLVNGRKNGKWLELYDKKKQKICTLKVQAVNTKDSLGNDKVNITQPEAAEAWQELIKQWLDTVNSMNGVQATGFYNNSKMTDLKGQASNPMGTGPTSATCRRRLKQ